MAGPWEKYQQAAPVAEGPWSRYAQPVPTPELPETLQPRPAAPTVERDLTTWEKVRPYVAPTVEALGAGGGALLGTSLGPAGTIGGAGLGYGIAKEALGLADVYLGQTAPRQGAQIITEPARNILEGATFEAGGRVVGQAIGKAAGAIADMRRIPQQKATEIARNALGPDLPEVLNALSKAEGQGISAAQATADINSPVWQALIERATKRDPRFLQALEASQGDVSLNALARLAGGRTAAEMRGTTEAAKKAVSTITTPVREQALKGANLGKEVARLEAEAASLGDQAAAQVQEVRRLMEAGQIAKATARLEVIKKGLPVGFAKYTYADELAEKAFGEWSTRAADASLDLGQGARFAKDAATTLRSFGIKPLEGEPLVRSLQAVSRNVDFAGNDLLEGALRNVSDDIAKWTGSGGVIDARALDAIRKNSVNAAIAKMRPGADATTQRNMAAGVLSEIKPFIDDAIEAAGGKGYRDYLKQHSQMMQKVAEKQLSGEALQMWKTNKDAFVNLVQNESPEVVERVLGPGKYNIAVELSQGTMDTLRSEAQKILRTKAAEKQATAGQEALKELMLQYMPKWRLPSYLSAVISTANKGLQVIEDKLGKKTMQALTEALKTPEGAKDLLNALPASERVAVINIIKDPTKWGTAGRAVAAARTGATAAAVNMLTADQEAQNALAP